MAQDLNNFYFWLGEDGILASETLETFVEKVEDARQYNLFNSYSLIVELNDDAEDTA